MPDYQPDYSAPPALSGSGISDNVAGGLAYITIIPAIIFLVVAPYNRRPFVRFHCFQSIFLFVVSIALNLLHIIPILGTILAFIGGLIVIVLAIVALVQAFLGKKFVIPLIGPLAEQAAAQ